MIERDATVAALGDQVEQCVRAGVDFDRFDFGARRHHGRDVHLVKVHHVFDQLKAGLGQGCVHAGVFDHVAQVFDQNARGRADFL